MNEQVIEILKSAGISIAAIWGYLKFFVNRIDTKIERKKRNIEILDSIVNNLPTSLSNQKESILELSSLEKFNAFYNCNFDFETMKACLNSTTPKKTIQVVKTYKRNIKIYNGLIIPDKLFDNDNKLWKYFFRIYFLFSVTLSIIGLFYPNIFSHGKELTMIENVVIRFLYVGLFIFIINETWKLKKAKKYIKTIS